MEIGHGRLIGIRPQVASLLLLLLTFVSCVDGFRIGRVTNRARINELAALLETFLLFGSLWVGLGWVGLDRVGLGFVVVSCQSE